MSVVSTKARIFPATGQTANSDSRLISEKSFTQTFRALTGNATPNDNTSTGSFVLEAAQGSNIIKVYIHGYYFECKLENVITTDTDLYAYIDVDTTYDDLSDFEAPCFDNLVYQMYDEDTSNETGPYIHLLDDPSDAQYLRPDSGTQLYAVGDVAVEPDVPLFREGTTERNRYKLHILEDGVIPTESRIRGYDSLDCGFIVGINPDAT